MNEHEISEVVSDEGVSWVCGCGSKGRKKYGSIVEAHEAGLKHAEKSS